MADDRSAVEIVEGRPSQPATTGDDVEMEGTTIVPGDDTVGESAKDGEAEGAAAEKQDDKAPEPRATFLNYLTSPVVTLLVGQDGTETILTAHQALLAKSPFFKEACAQFSDDGSPRQIELSNENTEAVGSFLEYLYTGEYFPRKLSGQRVLEEDPSMPSVDDTGDQLLKHARVYTLADKYGVSGLKLLSSSKIHCVNSTAKGEIAYARYVYQYTSPDDTTVRAPIASFWAARSHTLRAEAEDEFKSLCLEFPQFGYDVLTRVLDEKLKRERTEKMHPAAGPASGRKRARHSNVSSRD
ncbi:hypothetical protein SODALDRAFT_394035 [Sodiomyces alkalinus F11]|uniref:BTB domain-containing protein n=1 Tax=Sodiomyces alkalinus (strain CBS 110278 / VKM F-3762 / F11) TaxID=1314773 RepID=A0A3N2PNQ7_SODAK|nr:hypothetical protein SODALDRAFT_394035 [Sodiomyces alkalinus F11]ROT36161.1 hypothetical protein SODALDRAFT_394035 [Sodiomyces alkalinus F11]